MSSRPTVPRRSSNDGPYLDWTRVEVGPHRHLVVRRRLSRPVIVPDGADAFSFLSQKRQFLSEVATS